MDAISAIVAQSMEQSSQQVSQEVAVEVLKKALTMEQQTAAALINSLASAGNASVQTPSVPPIDILA